MEKLAKKSSLDTTRTLVWASRLQRRPLRAPTLTRNAVLRVTSPFEGGSCLVSEDLQGLEFRFLGLREEGLGTLRLQGPGLGKGLADFW